MNILYNNLKFHSVVTFFQDTLKECHRISKTILNGYGYNGYNYTNMAVYTYIFMNSSQ